MSSEYLKTALNQLISWIRNSVSPVPKKLLDQTTGLRTLPGSDRQFIWVPARRVLKHTRFAVPEQLTGRKRLSALNLKIQAWSQFGQTAYTVLWQGNQASVFAWDQDEVENRIRSHGFDPSRCEVVPEAFIRTPMNEGCRLVEVGDGIEGQYWDNGFLKHTRWWSVEPSSSEWSMFVRNAGLTASDSTSSLPEKTTPEWLEVPWHSALATKDLLTQVLMNKPLVVSIATGLTLPCMYLAGSWLTYSVMSHSTQAELEQTEVGGRAVREERSRALSALEYAEDIAGLNQFPHQIEIISKAHQLLSPFPVEINGWDFDDGVLEFGLDSEDDLDATVYIPIFENDAMFSRVNSSTRGTRLVMRMNVSLATDLPS